MSAEQLLGRFLKEAPKNTGAKGSRATGTRRVPVKDSTLTLKELGISKKESARAQKATTGLAKGAREKGTSRGADRDPRQFPSLAEAGIDKHLADRARKLAALSETTFERRTA